MEGEEAIKKIPGRTPCHARCRGVSGGPALSRPDCWSVFSPV